MKFLQLLIYCMLAATMRQLCIAGCLACNTRNECLFCDATQFYFLQNDSCAKQDELPGCKFMGIGGLCLECIQGYFVDVTTGKCFQIPLDKEVTFCERYTGEQVCEYCQQGRYLTGGRCEVVPSLIDFCRYHLSLTQCRECESSYLLDIDSKRCLRKTEIANCGFFSNLDCGACKTGYLLNKNMQIEMNLQLQGSSERQRLNEIMQIMYSERPLRNEYMEVCQKLVLKNCLTPLTFNKCLLCAPGFYLNASQQCSKNPLAGINNCVAYLSATQCLRCRERNFLSGNACLPVQEIENCVSYDGTKSSSVCLECTMRFFSSGSSCQLRQSSLEMANCATLQLNQDACAVCANGYIASSDGLKCFATIANCKSYGELASSTQSLTCAKCEQGFYPKDEFSCLIGSDVNCDLFTQQNNCLHCKNEYFLNNSKLCERQASLPNCETYSLSMRGECRVCSDNFYNFEVKKYCVFRTPVSNCAFYAAGGNANCIQCLEGYVLEGNLCNIITMPNCARQFQGICTLCRKGYALSQVGGVVSCEEPFNFIKANCNSTAADLDFSAISNFQNYCSQCLSNHYPIDFKDTHICVSNADLRFFQLQDSLRPNCVKYSNSGSCQQCAVGYFLEESSCVTRCSSGVYRLIGYKITNQGETALVEINNFNVCVDEFEGERVLAVGIDISLGNNEELDLIIKCNEGALPVISQVSKRYTVLEVNANPDNYVSSPNKLYPSIELCGETSTFSPIAVNCQYYQEFTVSSQKRYKCIKCAHQHTSIIGKDSSTAYFLESCQRNTNCSAKDYSPGLDLPWVKIFSCHECIDQTKLPVAFVRMSSSSKLLPDSFRRYTLARLSHIDDENVTNHNIKCLKFSPENLGYDLTSDTQLKRYLSLPDNCALAVVNLNVTNGDALDNRTKLEDGDETAKTAHFCAACKPGYRGTEMNNFYYFVKIRCEVITNCQGKNWLNSCSQCEVNYAYRYLEGKIQYDYCVAHPASFCLAASDSGQCFACQKGYQLNNDNICEQVKPANCQSSEHFNFKTSFSKDTLAYGLYHATRGQGCSLCQTGYTSILLAQNQPSFQCIQSLFLQLNNQSLSSLTKYIPFCENYGVDKDRVICTYCVNGYVLNLNGSACYAASVDCEIADGTQRCRMCKEGVFLVNGSCQRETATFCQIPNNIEDNSQARCKQCEPNYYLTKTYECESGEVRNCELYENFKANKCLKCLDGYALFNNSNRSHCYQLDPLLKCKNAELQSDQTYGASLSCIECVNPSDAFSSDATLLASRTICMQFAPVNFCLIYDKQPTLQSSTLNCLQCQEGYYLASEISCAARSYISIHCLKYTQDKDTCALCMSEQAFLNASGQCQENPKGIIRCMTYVNESTCEQCEKDYYLSNNSCLAVPTTQMVSNCILYSNLQVCSTCASGYFLLNNKCQVTEAQNCLTFESAQRCLTCPANFVLQENNSRLDCIPLIKSNCISFSQTAPYPCLVCSKNYYPDPNGDCQLASPPIEHCLRLESNTRCIQCEENWVLNSLGSACLDLVSLFSFYDSNCSNYVNKISCSLCVPGYYFLNDECMPCGNTGCFVCDSQNKELCYICQSNYYMNDQGLCIYLNSYTEDSSSEVLFVLRGVFFLLFLLN